MLKPSLLMLATALTIAACSPARSSPTPNETRAAPLSVHVLSTTPAAGRATTLALEVRAGDERVRSFDVVHEKKLHLLMVTPDLAWFAHEHPALQPDGTFRLDVTFPHGGPFRLFADFRASGRAGVVVPLDVEVEGAAPARVALTPTSDARTIGEYAVHLRRPALAAGEAASLAFDVERRGARVTDLEPYLGARGHLVVIHEDGETFLHSHPEDGAADAAVSFHTMFPKAGRYKAWAQLRHEGRTLTADFVVDVPARADAKTHAHAHH